MICEECEYFDYDTLGYCGRYYQVCNHPEREFKDDAIKNSYRPPKWCPVNKEK
jgi:hypothetical protein